MKKLEFEELIKELGLEKVYRKGLMHIYSKATEEYYIDKEKFNIYGCYINKMEEYVLFFTDAERGMVFEIGHFSTEDEAYEELFENVKQLDYEHKKQEAKKEKENEKKKIEDFWRKIIK